MFGAKKDEGPYFYRCLMDADLIYLHPRNNEADRMQLSLQERMQMGFNQELTPHPIRLKAADALKGRPPDVLKVEKPIAWFFTEEREKMVSRPKIDPRGFPMTRAREMRPKMTKIKFELIENPTEAEMARAIPLKLRDIDYADYYDGEPGITEVV